MRTAGLVAAITCTVACGFSSTPNGGDDVVTGACPWSFTPDYIDPCAMPTPDLDTLRDVTLTDAAAIDTYNGDIIGLNVGTPPLTTMVDGVRIVWTRNFTIAATGSLRATGDFPLAIVSLGSIRIVGALDVSSVWNGTAFTKGAGANPAACSEGNLAAAPGLQCLQHGGSGGGGGGFGAFGGDGGEGADGHPGCPPNDTDGVPGGGGGKALARRPPELRGGCPGGDGALTNNNGTEVGFAGYGGGAVALISRDNIVVSGTIHAGGAGGLPGKVRAGGGGGGSGGMIVLESVAVDIAATGILAANGGGGAGGVDNGTADAGADASAGTMAASGGLADNNGGTGGNGGALAMPAGSPGLIAPRGGGGGGGGVGFIRIHQLTGSTSGTLSPTATQD